ncbi:hypothetical protein P153DRAFT_116509 [Dothidotthia symphoricarpi CBS 119687]|uniref:Uncharacterized protein n=1 Tax=Dothidotthia symphoricarpi CBS 119687 TaxID=1392245 RepID=A0A6A6A2F5_9PLEO|nr:uncharacterized protein P153DRAFT_116509 [Dothidotthia symphoricarpi CBS 119687]KAF2124918.1 hypothetical protein P153DRAFT_116509 [Dothidotthia symphoricarpi CBS 119687]
MNIGRRSPKQSFSIAQKEKRIFKSFYILVVNILLELLQQTFRFLDMVIETILKRDGFDVRKARHMTPLAIVSSRSQEKSGVGKEEDRARE